MTYVVSSIVIIIPGIKIKLKHGIPIEKTGCSYVSRNIASPVKGFWFPKIGPVNEQVGIIMPSF